MAQALQDLQARLQDLEQRLQRGPQARVNTRMRTYKNGNDEDWAAFKRHARVTITLNNYDDRQARLALAGAMAGRAATAVLDINPLAEGLTLDQLINQYEERFLPPAAPPK